MSFRCFSQPNILLTRLILFNLTLWFSKPILHYLFIFNTYLLINFYFSYISLLLKINCISYFYNFIMIFSYSVTILIQYLLFYCRRNSPFFSLTTFRILSLMDLTDIYLIFRTEVNISVKRHLHGYIMHSYS